MNKMLVAIFDNETAAAAGLQALRKLHNDGDITLYGAGVVVKDAMGFIAVRKSVDDFPAGTVTGFAVGSLIGLLGGPLGVAVGAVAGTAAGAVRDFWAAGIGLDFVEEATQSFQPGKAAVVAEIEEEWVIPVDSAIEALGGHVFRRSRSELAEAQFDNDIAAFKSEIKELEAEASHATGAAGAKLQAKLGNAKRGLEGAVQRARRRVDALQREADAKAEALKVQISEANGDVKAKIEERAKRVRGAYHARGALLARAWDLTKEALTV